ncbi:MAG TPA: hypothetical protein VK508_00735 [Cyclobacteriaceae bacterium]|nr:hypothetical protein [Cyclobacteriaceae bacterium]
MCKPKKCIIDNWSLEHAGVLLEDANDLGQKTEESLIRNFGGLSNFIDAILLYEDSFFLMNGFEKDWKRFEWFDTNTSAFIEGIQTDELAINWTNAASYEDQGVGNYLLTSNYFESDLLICPERSETGVVEWSKLTSTFAEALELIDLKVWGEKNNTNFSKLQIGIESNFRLPSITQYVLAQASNRSDLLKVIMQLKSDGKLGRIIKEIEEITSTVKGAGRLEKDIDTLVKKAFGRKIKAAEDYSIGASAFGLGISKSFSLDFFRRDEYLVFLKHFIACRSEAFKLEKDFERIFGKKLRG